MIRVVMLLRRKPGMSRQAFIDYYETRHEPLAIANLPGLVSYRRNYVQEGPAPFGHAPSTLDIDVITEVVFATQEDHDRSIQIFTGPELGAAFAHDHDQMLDADAPVHAFFVTERHSVIPD